MIEVLSEIAPNHSYGSYKLSSNVYYEAPSFLLPHGVRSCYSFLPFHVLMAITTTTIHSSNFLLLFYVLVYSAATIRDPIFQNPLCKLNLKETSDFVRSFPMKNHHDSSTESRGFLDVSADQRRREGVISVTKRHSEGPSTPGRPIFRFSTSGNFSSRKCFPSKWDDAEKWLNGSSSCHDSPAHHHTHGSKPLEGTKVFKQFEGCRPQVEVFAEKTRVTEEKVTKSVSSTKGYIAVENLGISDRAFNYGISASANLLLKDKFTKEVEPISPKFRSSEPMREGFVFPNLGGNSMTEAATEGVHEVKHRDVGTEMTPLSSSTPSRCHTPFKSTSPARHNTPENRSGPLAIINSRTTNIAKLQDCHIAKLQIGEQFDSIVSTWSSREEEEEEISKSLRHFDISSDCRKSLSEPRFCSWEEEGKSNCCIRYQREEAKIQAWVNLQSARAEAQARKLEVKIEKMRSNLEEKLMKRMGVVHRKAEEKRAAAQLQHSDQIRRAAKQVHKALANPQISRFSGHITSCGCFPCTNNNHLYRI
ncbi:hypothetical protein RHMOL_Rhmol12G0248700 [Rhododendron molle]|uniref:Uncharacterized protein n=1 Tax=Rhododendron molle TaxID=49168 RepID=A0ACC0LM93_RHOML|nr:hypothetical protein RHMOL_Rhmol12G0248700 [Rhododendron molle]